MNAVVLGRRARQHRLLEPVRDVALLLEQQRAVEGERDLGGHGGGERALLEPEVARRVVLDPQHARDVRAADREGGLATAAAAGRPRRRAAWTTRSPIASPARAAPSVAASSPHATAPDGGGVGRRRQRRAEPLEPLGVLAREPLAVARADQLALVAPPVGGVEDRRADQARLAVGVALDAPR